MEIGIAANFLASMILFMLGLIVLVAAAMVINNLIFKYWKPVKIATYHTIGQMEPSSEVITKQKSMGKQKLDI
jgi:hypothetical protein